MPRDEQKFSREEGYSTPRVANPEKLPALSALADKRPWRTGDAANWTVWDAKNRQIADFRSITIDGETRGGVNTINAAYAVFCVNLVEMLSDRYLCDPEFLLTHLVEADQDFRPTGSDGVVTMQDAVVSWADRTLPGREASAIMLKFAEEAGELIQDPRSGKEYADVMVTLLDLAHWFGIDIQREFWMRIDQLCQSKWKKDPATGVARRDSAFDPVRAE